MNAKEIIEICVAEIAGNGKYELAEQLQREYDSLIMELAKSKEEAEDVVIKIIEAVSSEYRGAVELDEWYGLGEIIETIRSTAFGKEGER